MKTMKLFLLTLLSLMGFVNPFSLSAQNKSEKYIPPKEEIEWATQFAPVSGAGRAVVGDGYGGWRSGADGVHYKGAYPRPEYNFNFEEMARATAVQKGLVPPIKPAIELHLRDGVITLGGDGNYYLTGSSGDNIWAFTKGVELWKSSDLKSWEYVGLVWDIDRDADEWVKEWRKHPRRAVRAVWAPEIHYIKGNYFICFSMCPHGIGLLKSATGKPEGPYVNAFDTDQPIASGIDATLFEDEDGKVYFTYGNATRIALLKEDMSGFAEPFRQIVFDEPDHDPSHHAEKCFNRGMNDLGHEGAVLFKRNGKYYLGAADDYEGRYSTCLAISDSIYGPYRKRHESVPCGGGTGFFKDKKGNWWSSYFGNDSQSHFREKIGFIKVNFAPDGRVFPAKDQPFVSKKDKKAWQKNWKEIWKNKYQ
jgi:Beta-xylosidase